MCLPVFDGYWRCHFPRIPHDRWSVGGFVGWLFCLPLFPNKKLHFHAPIGAPVDDDTWLDDILIYYFFLSEIFRNIEMFDL